MEEIWKDIKGFEGLYQVSNLGRVKSLGRTLVSDTNIHKIRFWKERILKLKKNRGYNIVILSSNNKQTTFRVGRLVAQAFLPNPENKREVNHISGIKIDNVENLEWVTPRENTLHAIKIGLSKHKGEDNSRAKLTNKQAQEIRSKYIPYKYTLLDLSNEYKVSENIIWKIITNKSYKS